MSRGLKGIVVLYGLPSVKDIAELGIFELKASADAK